MTRKPGITIRGFCFLSSLLLVLSCSQNPSEPAGVTDVSLLIQATTVETTISTLVVEVTAPDISTPLVFNITIVDGVASGTIVVPVGADRTITIRAFDSSGIETHRGTTTTDVVESTNPTVFITLLPLTGEQPINVFMGSFVVNVIPATSSVAVGGTVQLTAEILDNFGNPVAEPVSWATVQPAIATVDQTGLVTGVLPGEAQIVATFSGVGGMAVVTVEEAAQTLGDVYVTVPDGNHVALLGSAGFTYDGTAPAGSAPHGIAITPDGAFAYVANAYSNDVYVIATADNSIQTVIGVGTYPWGGVAVRPDGAFVYVSNAQSSDVSVIDTATNTVVATVSVVTSPEGLAVTPDGAYVYVTSYGNGDMSVISTASNTVVQTISLPTAKDVAITPDGAFAYVTHYQSNEVSVIETVGNTVTAMIGVGNGPHGVAITPDGSYAYVTNDMSSNVSVIETASNTVVATVSVSGMNPGGLAITPDGLHVYVTSMSTNTLSVIETGSNMVVAEIGLATGQWDVAIKP